MTTTLYGHSQDIASPESRATDLLCRMAKQDTDQMASNILLAKLRLGLIERPYTEPGHFHAWTGGSSETELKVGVDLCKKD